MSDVLRKYGILLLIPGIVLVFSVLLKIAAGPYWLATNFDPAYPYLVNGLYLVKGIVPNLTEHPGTPLQMLCCVTCVLFNIGRPLEGIVTQVLTAPEFYLHAVFTLLSLFSFITSLGLAVYVYRRTGDKIAALLTQLPALSFLFLKSWETVEPVLPVVANVDPEPLLLVVLNLFNLCLLMSYFAKTVREGSIAALCWGFVCGLGVAVKLTFLPIVAAPLILLSWKNKFLFTGIFIASFFLWTLPIISKYAHIWDWIAGVLTHTGNVGKGKSGFIDIHSFILNWKGIIAQEGVFICIAFVAVVLIFWKFFKKDWDKGTSFLAATLLGMGLQFLAVTQHPGAHYLLPGLGLFSVILVLFYWQCAADHVSGRRIALAFVVAGTLLGTWQAMEYRSKLAELTQGMVSFYDHIHQKYQGYVFLKYYRASGQDAALQFGDGWNGVFYFKNELIKAYPDSYFFDIWWNNRIVTFKDRVLSNDLLDHYTGILFQADDTYDLQSFLTGSPFTAKLLEKGRFESIYLLTSTTEKQALEYFLAATHFYQTGELKQALVCALQAKALHFQPQKDLDAFIQFIAPYVQH